MTFLLPVLLLTPSLLCVSAQSKSLTGGADTDTYGQYSDSDDAYYDYYYNQPKLIRKKRPRRPAPLAAPEKPFYSPYLQYKPTTTTKPATTTQKPKSAPKEADRIVRHMHFHMNGPPDNYYGDYADYPDMDYSEGISDYEYAYGDEGYDDDYE